MPSTLIPTCVPWGLCFADGRLLGWPIREEHQQRGRPGGPGHGNPGDNRTRRPSAGGPSRGRGPASQLPCTTNEVIAVTATRRLRRPHPGGGMPALRRAIRAFGYVNEELLRAGEAMYPLLSRTATPAAARRDRRHACPPSFHDRTC